MWDNQHSSGTHPKIKVVDRLLESEEGLELHMKNRGERMGAQEEVTDDDVFKELINIVMDVFSTKSEKCMLTFELPVESCVLKEISPEEMITENGSEISSNASKSDILIPIKDSKNSREPKRKRKLKVPMAKTSRYKLKKKFKKRKNPIVQTALYPKQGFTDLERLFWMSPKQSNGTSRDCNEREDRVVESASMTDGWQDAAERDELLKEVSNLRKKIGYPSQDTDTYEFNNLYSEFKDVLAALEELIHYQERIPAKIPFGQISYHVEEIQCHIGAIGSLLQYSQSLESTDTTPQVTSTESSEAPKRTNKVGVKLIRIGAKIGRKSSTQTAPRSKNPKKHRSYKKKCHQDPGLEEILKNYQTVKKEETKIVQVLLGKMGFHKDRTNQKRRKRHSPTKKQESYEGSDKETAQIQHSEPAPNAQVINNDVNKYTNKEMLKQSQNTTISNLNPNKITHTTSLQNKRNGKLKKTGNHNEMSRKNKKNRDSRKKLRETAKRSAGDYGEMIDTSSRNHSPIILYGRPSPVFIERRNEIRDSFRKGKTINSTKFKEIQPQPSAANKEERMMRHIQSAAKRLEYMHSLVDKKLNRLSKQQKELNRKITWKPDGDYSPRESRSHEENQNDVYDMPIGPHLNLSTEIQKLIFQPYRNVKVDEAKNTNEPLTCHVDGLQGIEEVLENWSLGRNSSSTLEIQGNLNREQFICESNQNYICNYIMELPEKEVELTTGSKGNQHGREPGNIENGFPTTILTNEFQENASSIGHSNDPPARSLLSLTSKENEGEIIEESLFAKPLSPNKNIPKPKAREKMKRVIHTASCVLS